MIKTTSINTVNTKAPRTTKSGQPYKRVKYSNFFITINTQERYDDPNDSVLEERSKLMEQVLHKIFENPINTVIVKTDGTPLDPQKDFKLQNCDVQIAIERGPENKTLHAHIFLITQHYSTIKLDYNYIKSKFKEMMGIPESKSIHFFTRLVRDNNENVKAYLDKYLQEHYKSSSN